MRRTLFVAVAAALTGGCMSHNIGAPGTTMHSGESGNMSMGGGATGGSTSMGGNMDMGDMTPTAAVPYGMMAAASDAFEIQSAQMALQKSQRADVRSFAQMLIQHHTMTTQQLMSLARSAGMTPPPPRLMPMQQQMLQELQAAGPGEFDMVFLRQQVPAHEMALALHSNYAQNGDNPAVRRLAQAAVPLVTQHLNQARALMR